MNRTNSRRNLLAFGAMLLLLVLVAAGVYGTNRLLTHWLLVQSIQGTFNAWSNGYLEADEEPAIGTLRLSSTAEVTLRGAMGNDASLEDGETVLDRLRDIARRELGPDAVIASQALAFPAEWTHATTADIVAGLVPEFLTGTIGATDLATVIDSVRQANAPITTVYLTWWGGIQKTAIIALPQRSDGATIGALLLEVDVSSKVASVNRTLHVTTGLVGALCLASFLIAGFLLWLRFHDQVKTNQDIAFLAHHDPLTGLPNRAVFSARLNEALRLAHAKASNIAVILIDVDKFKAINDTYGHGTGDIYLQVIADRLRAVFGDHLVSRLSGDEFAVMIGSVSDVARLTRLAAEMISATKAPCIIDGKEIPISLSLGIARATDGSWRSSRLLHCADLALYKAKHSGRSMFVWYTPEMDAEAQKRKEIEDGLIKALKYDQFELVYQPQFSLHDDTLKGYEALIRWEHPTKGTISPDVFIAVAEDTGLIEEIGDWVLRKACKEAARWEDRGLHVAVNFSPAQFRAGETQIKVARALKESGLDPRRLEIEITESLLIADTEAVVDTLRDISRLGVTIAMDDFGTGYSSLSYLSRFPFDKIKIDRSFIRNLGKDLGTDAIVTSIIGLGRSLNVLITAEGVENQDQVTLLRAAGCDLVQGFLYGRPGAVRSPARPVVSLPGQASAG
ncbi:putative bifunctional diguanylate cyclase/phosphodiesterase [Polymorphum gilvum]|uniref:Cyclic diguanylate phosphodiesterase domain protein n=1 Tax=Polymorphum gilvum (strain LMG 25793 / CGMCC 1.9160 / SL003B-26A1) TaxID=991905 RepID=F2J1H7_POLGS|nr:bifunctional diguanylate cyclase/phosphodiesterase [Polymorphum gilvum]ADZ69759.1 Cyclic diguanylate phosphodiesterase domain protein [Polymorphum gilvum SL003B-26A1]